MNFYVDAYLAHNLGDDLFVKLLAELFPSVRFTVNYYGKYGRATFGDNKNVLFPRYSLPLKLLNRLHIYDYINDAKRISKEFDGFILLGGSIFREESYWNDVYHQRRSVIKAFRKEGKPVFVIGSNFGPVHTQCFIDRYSELFQLCTDVCFRDTYSYQMFSTLANVRMEKDVVFQYSIPKAEKKEDLIGIAVIDPDHVSSISAKRENYKEVLANTIKEYIGKGSRCRIFAFCRIEGDERIALEIKDLLTESEKKQVEVVVYDGCVNSFVTALGECGLLIASRFHANILGLLADVKLLPLVYSEKTANMLRDSLFQGEIINIAEIDQNTKLSGEGHVHTFPVEEYKKSAERQFSARKRYVSL